MSLFKKKSGENTVKNKKLRNKTALRRGGYSLALIAVAVVVTILVNVLMVALDERFVIKTDITGTGERTISQENVDFIKSVSVPVTVTVCASKTDYSGGGLEYYAKNTFNVTDESGEYYKQTIRLLDQYDDYNPNITVNYVDITTNEGLAISSKYPTLFYGDIIVEYKETVNGEEVTNSKHISYEDIYTYSDSTGYASYGYSSYTVDGNKLESALSSAINSAISKNSKNAAFLSNHSDKTYKQVFETFKSQMGMSNFNVTEIDDAIISSIPENIDTLIIFGAVSDFLEDEINVINKWLDNDGMRGKSLIYVPATGVELSSLPNLTAFLQEWCISYSDGIVYETSTSNRISTDPTTMYCYTNESDLYKKMMPEDVDKIVAGYNVPMLAGDAYSTRKPNVLVSTQDTTVAAPIKEVTANWTPDSSYEKMSYANIIVTEDSNVVDNVQHTSYVAAFSSYQFMYPTYANISNLDVSVSVAKGIAGMEVDSKLSFLTKTVSSNTFAEKVTQTKSRVINIIFIFVIPLTLVVFGITIWIKRKNK